MNSADPVIRAEFDNITSAMTSILTAVGAAMREANQDKTRATLAEQATGWVKPLVALAGGIINGGHRGRRRLHHDPLMPMASPFQPSHPQLAVSAAIFRDDKSCWCGARARRPRAFIRCPGGRVEFGETLHAALHREVDEETGAENRDRRPCRLARGGAGSRRRRALSDHVVRGALDLPASRC